MHVFHGSANGGGAVSEDINLNRSGKGRLELREKFLYAVDHGNDVCARLPLNIENDGGILIGPRRLLAVFHAVDDVRDIAEADRRAIAVSNDERAITIARKQLVVGANGKRLMQAVKSAFGHVHVGLAESGAQVLKTQPVGSERRGIRLNTNGGALAAADADQPHAGKLRNFLGEGSVCQVFHFGERQTGRGKRERQDGRVRRIGFAVDRRIGKALRQEVRGPVDGRLNFLLGDVNVEVQLELQRDDRAPEGARGGHLVQPGNLAELALERCGDRRGHYIRAATGIKRLYLNRGVVNLRQGGNRQLAIGHPADQYNAHHEQRSGNRPQNKRPRRTHRREPPDWARGELDAGDAL